MNFHLWVIFLKTVNNYIDNQFMWATVTPGFKLFAFLFTGVLFHIVLLRVSWEGFFNLEFLNGFKTKKKPHYGECHSHAWRSLTLDSLKI